MFKEMCQMFSMYKTCTTLVSPKLYSLVVRSISTIATMLSAFCVSKAKRLGDYTDLLMAEYW
jgi:hypothetical protein